MIYIDRDDTTRTVTTYDEHGQVTSTRPYTAGENTAADEAAAAAQRAANEAALRAGLAAVIDAALSRQADMQAIIDTPNATINQNPAQRIVAIARNSKRQERAHIRLARLAGDLLDSIDTGTD